MLENFGKGSELRKVRQREAHLQGSNDCGEVKKSFSPELRLITSNSEKTRNLNLVALVPSVAKAEGFSSSASITAPSHAACRPPLVYAQGMVAVF